MELNIPSLFYLLCSTPLLTTIKLSNSIVLNHLDSVCYQIFAMISTSNSSSITPLVLLHAIEPTALSLLGSTKLPLTGLHQQQLTDMIIINHKHYVDHPSSRNDEATRKTAWHKLSARAAIIYARICSVPHPTSITDAGGGKINKEWAAAGLSHQLVVQPVLGRPAVVGKSDQRDA